MAKKLILAGAYSAVATAVVLVLVFFSPAQSGLERADAATQQDYGGSSSTSLFDTTDPTTASNLKPWVDTYFADRKDAESITGFELVEPNYDLLRHIRKGEVSAFQFLFKDDAPIQVEVAEVNEHPSSWFVWGSTSEHPGSIAEFTVEPDGSINGVISLPGLGQYGIRPSGQLPYHLVYFTRGVSSYD
jgi:hypothetical protein